MPTTHARVARTSAATAANRRRAATRAAQTIVARLDDLDSEQLTTLAALLADEASDRGLTIPRLRA